MANEEIVESPPRKIITINRREALEIVAFVASQLAKESLPNTQTGSVPSIDVIDKGICLYRLIIVVDTEM